MRARATLLATMAALAATAHAQAPPEATLTVRVNGLRKAQGRVGVTVFQDPRGFPEEPARAVRLAWVNIETGALKAEAVFRGLAPGVYAVATFHDENANGKFDKNFLGIPKEGHGTSNNPAPARRAPTFDEAKFTLGAPEKTLDVNLNY